MIKRTLQRGFTLIELLVVIAIIGILAAVVLTSLNDARDNANDASAKSSITSIRAQAEIWYNENSYSYTGMCADASITRLTAAADAQNGAGGIDCDVSVDGTAYAAEVDLRDGTFFCVDSGGNSGVTTDKADAATVCP